MARESREARATDAVAITPVGYDGEHDTRPSAAFGAQALTAISLSVHRYARRQGIAPAAGGSC